MLGPHCGRTLPAVRCSLSLFLEPDRPNEILRLARRRVRVTYMQIPSVHLSTSGPPAFRHPRRRRLPGSTGTAGALRPAATLRATTWLQPKRRKPQVPVSAFHAVAPVAFPASRLPLDGGQPHDRLGCSAAGYAVSTLASRQTFCAMFELPSSLCASSRNACISNLGVRKTLDLLRPEFEDRFREGRRLPREHQASGHLHSRSPVADALHVESDPL